MELRAVSLTPIKVSRRCAEFFQASVKKPCRNRSSTKRDLLDILPYYVLNIILGYLTDYSLSNIRCTCREIKKIVNNFSLIHNIIRIHQGQLQSTFHKLLNNNIVTDGEKWRNHNFFCHMCEGEFPDLKCFSCNLCFHSTCLSSESSLLHPDFVCDECRKDWVRQGPVTGFAFAYFAVENQILIVGGQCSSNLEFNKDVYGYNLSTCQWSYHKCIGDFPANLNWLGSDTACLVTETGSAYCVRENVSPESPHNQGHVPSIHPTKDNQSKHPTNSCVWYISSSLGLLRDAHVLSLGDRRWTTLELSGDIPLQKRECAICFLPSLNIIVVHGGWRSHSHSMHGHSQHPSGALDELHFIDTGNET